MYLTEAIYLNQLRWIYLKKKNFSQFSCTFLKFALHFEYFQKQMTPLANVFPKSRTAKDVVR